MPTRREFIRQIAILLASTTVTRSAPLPGQDSLAHARLRRCWKTLDRLKSQTRKDRERGEWTRERLKAAHRSALDDLVEADEIDADVAEHIQAVFNSAAYYAWRSNAGTCYLGGPLTGPFSQGFGMVLDWQIEALNEIDSRGEVDPETIAQARARVERDMVLLTRFGKFDDEIPPDVAQAARFLVELLSGQSA